MGKKTNKIPKIIIEFIPHTHHRYETCGDYYKDKNGDWLIFVSQMSGEVASRVVAVHELIEFILTDYKGIEEKSITKFDETFEAKRKRGNTDEPGFDPKAPYRDQHAIATAVELMMCAHMGIAWKEYEDKINAL